MSGRPLAAALAEVASGFDFFQLVRLLEWEAGADAAVGREASPDKEAVRFEQRLSLAFPSGAVHELEARDEGPSRMIVTLFGLYGAQGVLPRHYTTLLLEHERRRDRGLRRFFDLFNHRLISFLFRVNEKHRYVSVRRRDGQDPITGCLSALLGREPGAAARGTGRAVPGQELLRYVGLFTQRPRSVQGLVALLRDYFDGIPLGVAQFIGRWVALPVQDQGRLDAGAGTNQLSRTLVIGERIWDRQGKFRVLVGPLGYDEFVAFQPGGLHFAPLCELVREYIGHHLHFDVLPLLRAEDVPPLTLDATSERAPRLGRNTWFPAGVVEPVAGSPVRGAAFAADASGRDHATGEGLVHAA